MVVVLGGIIPITEFIMANKYKSKMEDTCDSFLSPYVWIIVNGVVNWISIIIPFMWLFNRSSSDEPNSKLSLRKFILCFDLAWIICGCVMFWHDCSQLENKSMNNFYWFVLIFSMCMHLLHGISCSLHEILFSNNN